MKPSHLLASLCLLAGCADADAPDPTAPALVPQGTPALGSTSAARQVDASGTFAATVDFSTLALTPRGSNCLLEVEGRLTFSGTIVGTAPGRTSALVFATCDDVLVNPPGTFADVFQSKLQFSGTVDGQPVEASVHYLGRVRPGGRIEGRLVWHGDARGSLDAEAIVAVGGSYRGSVVVQ